MPPLSSHAKAARRRLAPCFLFWLLSFFPTYHPRLAAYLAYIQGQSEARTPPQARSSGRGALLDPLIGWPLRPRRVEADSAPIFLIISCKDVLGSFSGAGSRRDWVLLKLGAGLAIALSITNILASHCSVSIGHCQAKSA